MGSVSNPAIINSTRQGSFDAKWASVYSILDFPKYFPELVKRYGKLFEIFDILRAAGQIGTCQSETITQFEQGSPERYVTLHSATGTVAAGTPFTMEIEEWNTVANGGTSAVSVGDKLAIPAEYCTISSVKCTLPEWVQVTAIANTTANPNEPDTNITVKPLNQLTTIAVTVPAGTRLMVTGGNYAAGSGGAQPKTNGYYSRTFRTSILKEAIAIEGSQQSSERYLEHLQGGGVGILSEATIQGEFRLDRSINYEMLMGGVVDNLTMNNRYNVANSARGTLGMLPQLNANGCLQYFDTKYTVSDLNNIKKAFISQGVVETSAKLFAGNDFLQGLEDNALDYIKEYSGGSNLLDNLGNLGAKFRTITKGGTTISLHELASLSNPNTLANYGMSDFAMIIPDSQVTVRDTMEGSDMKVDNLRLLYKNYNGEDRTRIMTPIPGVNGLTGAPNFAVDSYDDASWQLLTEFMLAFYKVNQCIFARPSSVL